MVSADTARTVVGIIGNIISLFLFLSPLPTFARIWRKGSVEQYSAVPYLATLVNCMVWTLYGLPLVHPKSILVVTINGTGTIIEFAYVILFFIYSNDKKQRLQIVVVVIIELIFVAVLSIMVLTLAHTHTNRSLVVGIIGIFFNVMMYASPLSVMVPNGLGTLSGLLQLILYAAYYKSTIRQMAARKEKLQVEMAVADHHAIVDVNHDAKKSGTTATP